MHDQPSGLGDGIYIILRSTTKGSACGQIHVYSRESGEVGFDLSKLDDSVKNIGVYLIYAALSHKKFCNYLRVKIAIDEQGSGKLRQMYESLGLRNDVGSGDYVGDLGESDRCVAFR